MQAWLPDKVFMNILITSAFGFVGANLSKAPESLRVGEAPLGFNLNS
jgi:hypothetical protein